MTTMTRPRQQVWESFDEFVQLRGPSLWRSAYLLSGDRHRAEDLVQDALSRCWSKFSRLNNDEDSFEAYVRKAIFHAYLAWWRTGARQDRPLETVPEPSTTPITSSGDLARALRELPKQQRAVIVLRYFDDLTEQQTADVLGIAIGTVKQHAHRAIAALRHSPHLSDDDRAALPADRGEGIQR